MNEEGGYPCRRGARRIIGRHYCPVLVATSVGSGRKLLPYDFAGTPRDGIGQSRICKLRKMMIRERTFVFDVLSFLFSSGTAQRYNGLLVLFVSRSTDRDKSNRVFTLLFRRGTKRSIEGARALSDVTLEINVSLFNPRRLMRVLKRLLFPRKRDDRFSTLEATFALSH